MAAIIGIAQKFKANHDELQVLDGELGVARATLVELEAKREKAAMERNRLQRELLEEAKR